MSDTYTSTVTLTVPANMYRFSLTFRASGAAGGRNSAECAGGGGGQGAIGTITNFPVVPGDTITLTIARPGVCDPDNPNSGNCGDSAVNYNNGAQVISLAGANRGENDGAGGAGGIGSAPSGHNFSGYSSYGNGASGATAYYSSTGGQGGGDEGGAGGTPTTAPGDGSGFGSGGGGAGHAGPTQYGGSGSQGYATVTFSTINNA